MAVDATDDRFAELRQLDEKVGQRVATVMQLERGLVAGEAGEICARTERAIAGPGQDHNRDRRLALAPRQGRSQVAHHRRGQRVALLWPVERDGRDRFADLDENVAEARWGAHEIS